jgi:formylglycine-generating enzyme required for sulfatase activity
MSVLSQLELEARERLVDEAATDNFADLIRIAGLDPKKHLRFADWSGVDFSRCDLRGFDFTGARLIACNFLAARIEGARFDQALIDEVRPGAKLDPNRTYLRRAKDWDRFADGWNKPEKRPPEHLPAGAVFQDAPFAPEMVVVPPGRFMMGSEDGEGGEEGPRHEVVIPQAFAVGRFPVTFDEWDAAAGAGGVKYKPIDYGWGRGRRPVINISWNDAQIYVRWLCKVTSKPYRLLSESEWEYACRAGTETAYSFGDAITEEQAQFMYELGFDRSTVEVGSFNANAFGLYDMHGNVWEWCRDRWHNSYARKPERFKQTGEAWRTPRSPYRIVRGGSWLFSSHFLRSASREKNKPDFRDNTVGFRVARTIPTS